MAKRRDWSKIGEVVERIRELSLTYKEGADRFGLKVHDLYDYNHLQNRKEAQGEETETGPTGGGGRETGKKGRGSQLPEEVKKLFRSYRRDHPTHGFKRIANRVQLESQSELFSSPNNSCMSILTGRVRIFRAGLTTCSRRVVRHHARLIL